MESVCLRKAKRWFCQTNAIFPMQKQTSACELLLVARSFSSTPIHSFTPCWAPAAGSHRQLSPPGNPFHHLLPLPLIPHWPLPQNSRFKPWRGTHSIFLPSCMTPFCTLSHSLHLQPSLHPGCSVWWVPFCSSRHPLLSRLCPDHHDTGRTAEKMHNSANI